MTSRRDELTNPRRRLPDLELPALPGGTATRLRPRGREAPVLVLLHGTACGDCLAYLRRLADGAPEIQEWDGRLCAVLTEAPANGDVVSRLADLPFAVVVDPELRLSSALGIQSPATVVADQWGEIHATAEAGPEHRLEAPEELARWARYLAVQCPECEGEAL